MSILFLGGWDPLFFDLPSNGWIWAVIKVGVLFFKVFLMVVFIMWIRWTLPRFRYDQLMNLAWKGMIPLALLNLIVTMILLQLFRGIS
jgi:NADH-quinone oxidoreductase subunit H